MNELVVDDVLTAPRTTVLQAMRADLYEILPDAEWLSYWRALSVDHATVQAHCGSVWTAPLRYFPGRRFDFLPDDDGPPGVASAIIECLDAHCETVADLVAWPIGRPEKFATAFGFADVLGASQIEDPATYFDGAPLQVHRTPEKWLRAGCAGCVPLNRTSAAPVLGAALGLVAAEDLDHGRELARLLGPFFDLNRIIAPLRGRAAA